MSEPTIHLNLTYGADPAQNGDLYLPAAAQKVPVVVIVHGGFWTMPYDKGLMTQLSLDLAKRGYAAWNIEYRRLNADGGGWPGEFQDVADAVDHLRILEKDGMPLDLARVASVGHSAGGHFALWIAGRHHIAKGQPGAEPRVHLRAAVGQAPVPDLVRGEEIGVGRGVVDRLLGGSPKEFPERYAAASPRALLPLGVPQLIVHGDADQIVPLELSRAYAADAKVAHDSIELKVLPAIGHFEHLDPKGVAWAPVVPFLDRVLAKV